MKNEFLFGSICSGIEAASVAWEPLGWEAAFFSEIDKSASKLLKHRYPNVPNHGDMTEYERWKDHAIRLLCGGTPCQSFSVAGLRKGLDDARGNLMLTFGEILARYRPDWFLWENVPGVLSSNGGRDFAAFLGLVSGQKVSVPKNGWRNFGIIPGYKNAYGIAYRVHDAQYFGLAQRRRRVFVIGYIGDWRPAAAVLLERDGLCGHPAPRRETGQRIAPCVTNGPPFSRTGNERVEAEAMVVAPVAPTLQARTKSGGGLGTDFDCDGGLVCGQMVSCNAEGGAVDKPFLTAANLSKHVNNQTPLIAQTLRAEGFDASEDGTGRQNLVPIYWDEELNAREDMSGAVIRGGDGGRHAGVAIYPINTQISTRHESLGERTGLGIGSETSPAFTLQANHCHAINRGADVRRLTPVECERLQGFPDNYTLLINPGPAPKKKPKEDVLDYFRRKGFEGIALIKAALHPDGPRYKQLGNSWAVLNVRYLGQRIQMVEEIIEKIRQEKSP